MISQKQLTQIRRVLKTNGVILAYIFGSFARGKVGHLSDFDIAVVFSKKISQREHFDKQLEIASEIGNIMKIERVDVINLETASGPLLKRNAVFGGKIILGEKAKIRFNLERKIMQEYEDTKYLREVQYYYLRKHIREGSFGKAPFSPSQTRIMQKYVNR